MYHIFKKHLPTKIKNFLKLIFFPIKLKELEKKIDAMDKNLKEHIIPAYLSMFHNNKTFFESPNIDNLKSQLVTYSQTESRIFSDWCQKINHPVKSHRKLWEWIYILQALNQEKCIRPGLRGLGFGVGTERIVSYLASCDCRILATDQYPEEADKQGWTTKGQYATKLSDLNQYNLCENSKFNDLVEYRYMDMNNIDYSIGEFDFLWSSCALEHLGSLQKGNDFILNSLKLLKPGGIAVHTTEFNLSSNVHTIESGHTVIYRKTDVMALQESLLKNGHHLEIDLNLGNKLEDLQIAFEPYDHDKNHLKILIEGFVATSFGLLIKKSQ